MSDEECDEEGNPIPREQRDPEAVRHALLVPEKDYMFESSMRFRRNTTKPGDMLEPII